jgi:N utilization substance protein B
MQALYQWQMTDQSPGEILRQLAEDRLEGQLDEEMLTELVHGVPEAVETLDTAIGPLLDREVEQLDPIERAILRLGAYELTRRPEVPWRVVVNEAVELARVFGAESSHKYINGVLDALARRVRAQEVERH